MSRRRYDRDFNNYGEPDFMGSRGHRGPGGIFGLVFSVVSLGLTIAFNVLELVLHIFNGLLGGNRPQRYAAQNKDFKQQAAPGQNAGPQEENKQAEAKASENMKKQHIKKEQVKETFNQTKEEHTSDWNIMLFVLTLIPVIVTLAMKRLDLTGLVVLGGTVLIVLYNLGRGAVVRSKKNKKQKQSVKAEESKEDTEIERVIKEAFDKVYAIRKELYRVKKQEVVLKLEHLCNMAEKIIGEVRSNPDCLNSVRKFFYYYLDAFTEVFEKYMKLSAFGNTSEEVQKLLLDTEKSFQDMDEIFTDICENMLEKDMLNLKATINVLKNSNYTN